MEYRSDRLDEYVSVLSWRGLLAILGFSVDGVLLMGHVSILPFAFRTHWTAEGTWIILSFNAGSCATSRPCVNPLSQQKLNEVRFDQLPGGRTDGAWPSGSEVIGPIFTTATDQHQKYTTYIYFDHLQKR